MSTDTILKKILKNKILGEKYWPEITDVDEINMSIIATSDNIYLKYIYFILTATTDQARRNSISNLLNN
jgi:hypothetical protein